MTLALSILVIVFVVGGLLWLFIGIDKDNDEGGS